MAKYVVVGMGDVPFMTDGKPYNLLKDGVYVFGGAWAECLSKAYDLGVKGDTITGGHASVDKDLVEQREKSEWYGKE